MNNFSDISIQLSQSSLAQHSLKTLEALEEEVLFSIACRKDQIFRSKKSIFEKSQPLKIYVIANNTNFGNIASEISGRKINVISSELLKSHQNFDNLLESFKNSLVISTSNIFAEIGAHTFGTLYEKSPQTIFVMQDYDNHHWIGNNIQVAIFSDIYIPAHQDENLIAARLNPNILGGIPCGSNQWSREYIRNSGSKNLLHPRALSPLGKYFYYEKFLHRNKSIHTLSQNYSTIGFVQQDFHLLSPEEKWLEWSGHALHWIAPVLNDLPIRFFDALITGGIPLIPSGLRPFVEALQIPRHFYATYGPLDILDPQSLLETERIRFQNLGDKGILDRHEYALKHFHVDILLDKMITESLKLYGAN